ncbi:hypothetical protein ACSNOI_37900, partial [Actinomadura kijaniata]|uniref:hypothetical protein n=1 Tax=Actinomadura kijaniata TaxID=46161 RepID=UPI003F1D5143
GGDAGAGVQRSSPPPASQVSGSRGAAETWTGPLRDTVPQVAGLVVAGLLTALLAAPREPDTWLAGGGELRWTPAPASPPRPGPQPPDGLLDQVVGQRGGDDRQQQAPR